MKRGSMSRRFFIVSFFTLVFAFNIALAQNQTGGAAQGVVLESVDEDIVDDDEIVSEKDASSSSESAKNNQQKEKSDDGDNVDSDELDIDKLLAGDEEEDLLAEEKAPVKESVAVVDSVSADSLMKSAETLPDSQVVPQYGEGGRGRGRNENRRASAQKDTVDLGPAVIEDGRSINFANNLSEYRSPKMAMLLSLLVPGLGQAYSRSYVKAGAFGAAEIAAVGTAIYYNRAGRTKKREAYRHADKYFRIDNLKEYENEMRDKFDTDTDKIELPFDDEFYNAAGKKESYYYESIRSQYFTPGWIDLTPSIDEIVDGSGQNPLSWQFGASSHQAAYNSMMRDSKSKYDAVNYALYVVLINHIVSAVDAGFTAKAYNSNLLGKDNSVWERVSVEQQYVFSGSEMSPGAALKFRF